MDSKKYYISEYKNKIIEIKNEISKDEVDNLVKLTENLKYFTMAKLYMEIAIDNGLELYNFFNKIKNTHEIKEINRIKSSNISIKVNRLLLNYLVSFRLFVDNLQKRYAPKITHGKEFETKVLNKLYDSEPIYAFMYELRNYVTHVNIAINKLKYAEHQINLICDRNHLLNTYKKWKKNHILFLNSLPNDIDLMPMIEKNNTFIMNIYLSFISYFGKEIQEVHDNVIKAVKKYNIINPIIYVCKNKQTLKDGYVIDLGLDVLNDAITELSKVPNVKINYLSEEDILNSKK